MSVARLLSYTEHTVTSTVTYGGLEMLDTGKFTSASSRASQ